ncbi:AtpZ/AtpI family protein [Parvularcula marina]|uniref:AtpZ/AtpI family protein n=1 Tax=Parvularcula marina TaxID=2292771 RepID=UPI00351357D6
MSDAPEPSQQSFKDLEARIEKGREKAGLNPPRARRSATGQAGRAYHASIGFVVSTLVGTALGFGLGTLAGNRVVGLMLGLALGFAAGLRELIRIAKDDQAENDKERDGNGRSTD